MAYGGQRSATTSIVPNVPSNFQTSWAQTKFSKQQSQVNQQQQQQQQRTSNLSRTNTNQSIASSNSSSTISSTNTNNTNSTSSALSPSSSSSMSASSSIHQIAPMNASSPRSRNTSPPFLMGARPVISPSGLLTDGPLGRRPVVNHSPLRDRSASPVYDTRNKNIQAIQNAQILSQLNGGSNSNLQTIAESKIPTPLHSPMVNRKQGHLIRKSFLPQPVSYPGVQPSQRRDSISPIRYENRSIIAISSKF